MPKYCLFIISSLYKIVNDFCNENDFFCFQLIIDKFIRAIQYREMGNNNEISKIAL